MGSAPSPTIRRTSCRSPSPTTAAARPAAAPAPRASAPNSPAPRRSSRCTGCKARAVHEHEEARVLVAEYSEGQGRLGHRRRAPPRPEESKRESKHECTRSSPGWRCWLAAAPRPPSGSRRGPAPRRRGGAQACAAFNAGAVRRRDATAPGYAADAAKGLPAYCEVSGTLHPVAGSNIGVVYRLPDNWNGKVYGIGGGGWIGNITLQAASEALQKGYATMQTDGGHPGIGGVWDNAWAGQSRGGQGLQLPRDPRDDGRRQEARRRLLRQRSTAPITSAARPAGAWG